MGDQTLSEFLTGEKTVQAEETPQETSQETTQEEPKEDKVVPLSEHVKLRESRREARARVEELERENAYLRGQATTQTPKADPQESVDRFLDDPYAVLDERDAKRDWNQKVATSQMLMRDKHEDYDEMEAEFRRMAAADPSLGAALRASSHPAKFAYDTAKRHLKPPKSEEELRKEIEAELEKKYREKAADEAVGSVPKTQAGASGAGASSDAVNDDLASILPTKEFNT